MGPRGAAVGASDLDAVQIRAEGVVIVDGKEDLAAGEVGLGQRESFANRKRSVTAVHVREDGGIVVVAVAQTRGTLEPSGIVESRIHPGVGGRRKRPDTFRVPPKGPESEDVPIDRLRSSPAEVREPRASFEVQTLNPALGLLRVEPQAPQRERVAGARRADGPLSSRAVAHALHHNAGLIHERDALPGVVEPAGEVPHHVVDAVTRSQRRGVRGDDDHAAPLEDRGGRERVGDAFDKRVSGDVLRRGRLVRELEEL
jgi:hypothetical protein